jgi:perosamine synthetase
VQVRLFKPKVHEEAISAAAEVMRSGWLGMGPVTAEFEKAFARYLGVERAVAVNCVIGSSAMKIS